jgi:probable rRNA maturation factor
MPDGHSRISVHVEYNGWNKISSVEKFVSTLIYDTCRYMGVYASPEDKREISALLSTDARIQDLNHQFRGKNTPTNVLSFPAQDKDYIGDIIVAYETMQREAAAQKKPLSDHLAHLTVHGTLHLLGFDHEAEEEAQMMEDTEIRILATHGIANPYKESL